MHTDIKYCEEVDIPYLLYRVDSGLITKTWDGELIYAIVSINFHNN